MNLRFSMKSVCSKIWHWSSLYRIKALKSHNTAVELTSTTYQPRNIPWLLECLGTENFVKRASLFCAANHRQNIQLLKKTRWCITSLTNCVEKPINIWKLQHWNTKNSPFYSDFVILYIHKIRNSKEVIKFKGKGWLPGF